MDTTRLRSVFLRGWLSGLLVLAIGTSWQATASAQTGPAPEILSEVVLVPVVGAAKHGLVRSLGSNGGVQALSPLHHECPNDTPHVQEISCGSTTTDQLTSTGSCRLDDGSYVDFYGFNGTAGQRVTITMNASYDTFLFLLDPSRTVVEIAGEAGGPTTSQIVFTLNSTGSWFIAANSYAANQFGPYTLSLVCSGGGQPSQPRSTP